MEFDFGEVESLDTVPEQFRSLYSDKPNEEKKFSLLESHKGVATSIQSYAKNLAKARADAKSKYVDLSPISEYGSTPAEIKEGIERKLQEIEATHSQKGDAKWEGQKKALQEGFAKELDAAKKASENLKGQLYTVLVENAARSALTTADAIDPELVLPFIRTQVKVEEGQDGKLAVVVVDDQGQQRYSSATAAPLSIAELVTGMKSDPKYGPLFKSQKASGGGMPPGSGSRVTPPAKSDNLSPAQKISAGLNTRSN